jgi:hypothetical protein
MVSFPQASPPNPVHTSPLPHMCHMPGPSHLDFTTRTILGKEYRSLSSSLCHVLHSPIPSSLLGPNTLLSTPFSNTFSLRSSLTVSDQPSHPYKTTGKGHIVIVHISFNIVLERNVCCLYGSVFIKQLPRLVAGK